MVMRTSFSNNTTSKEEAGASYKLSIIHIKLLYILFLLAYSGLKPFMDIIYNVWIVQYNYSFLSEIYKGKQFKVCGVEVNCI